MGTFMAPGPQPGTELQVFLWSPVTFPNEWGLLLRSLINSDSVIHQELPVSRMQRPKVL